MTSMTTAACSPVEGYNTEPIERGAYILKADMTWEEIEAFRQVWQNMVEETGKQSYVVIVSESFDIQRLTHDQLVAMRDMCNNLLNKVVPANG